MNRHVYLIGMPGSGKSSVGRALAGLLDAPFVDLDEEIERSAGSTIAEIFRNDGEAAFRELERVALQRAAAGPASVVSCGGGAPLRDDNQNLMRTTGRIIWLDAPPEKLWKRIRLFPRPVANDPVDFRRLYKERDAVYRSLAEHRVRTDAEPEDVARKVAEVVS